MQTDSKCKETSIVVPDDSSEKTANRFLEQLLELIGTSPSEILMDCSKLRWVTSKHINMLWQAHIRCEESGIEARLINTTEKLIHVLQLLDIYDLIMCDPAEKTDKIDISRMPPDEPLNHTWQIYFELGVDDIKTARDRFQQYLKTLNASDLFSIEIETAFYEVATNIRLHSQVPENSRILMQCTPDKDRLKVLLKYPGIFFDPTKAKVNFEVGAAARNGQNRGYGLVMILRMTDELHYERDDNDQNILTMKKRWR